MHARLERWKNQRSCDEGVRAPFTPLPLAPLRRPFVPADGFGGSFQVSPSGYEGEFVFDDELFTTGGDGGGGGNCVRTVFG
ncbi:hypothetical protein GWI33_006980 [Rhynchophorus ferrugineus]|uniref:Uncharacterized protein n=1 Tax=Rhynchophorus ferrugineus TaxID=354439 RepID=A0A834MGY0_RHYFE|nr:hypothetical protein GWI33_006980 [Rhynchophorus ferrugineus]